MSIITLLQFISNLLPITLSFALDAFPNSKPVSMVKPRLNGNTSIMLSLIFILLIVICNRYEMISNNNINLYEYVGVYPHSSARDIAVAINKARTKLQYDVKSKTLSNDEAEKVLERLKRASSILLDTREKNGLYESHGEDILFQVLRSREEQRKSASSFATKSKKDEEEKQSNKNEKDNKDFDPTLLIFRGFLFKASLSFAFAYTIPGLANKTKGCRYYLMLTLFFVEVASFMTRAAKFNLLVSLFSYTNPYITSYEATLVVDDLIPVLIGCFSLHAVMTYDDPDQKKRDLYRDALEMNDILTKELVDLLKLERATFSSTITIPERELPPVPAIPDASSLQSIEKFNQAMEEETARFHLAVAAYLKQKEKANDKKRD